MWQPRSSRVSSRECFVVCQHYCPPRGYVPIMFDPMMDPRSLGTMATESAWPLRPILPFIACGDLSGFDARPEQAEKPQQAAGER
jgi:tRNA (cytidine32/guanosine34-2'-O)-methyltransferase